MPESVERPAAPTEPASAEPTSAERRRGADRRREPGPDRRGPKQSPWSRRAVRVSRDVLVAATAIVAIVFTVRHLHPVFANQPTVVASLTKAMPVAKAVLVPPQPKAPTDTGRLGQIVSSAEFERDRKAFSADLMKTGRVTQERADSIAYYAVREAYVNGIPPAVVFGVMLTENARFVSGALSDVGAVGLMQVYPKVWLKALKGKFGSDLAADSTNLKYGIYILKQYIKTDSGTVKPTDVSTGLLRYNGCVRGSHTPNCKTYPSKVKTYVEKSAVSMCGDKSFYDCIAKPFIAGLFGKSAETQ